MLTLLIGGWQRVVYSAALEVTDILSYRDKHTDRIIQLNCNRILLTPSQAEGYANKLLPHCPVWRSIPHYPAQLWARDQDSSDLRSSADVVVKLGEHLKRTTQTCRLTFFFPPCVRPEENHHLCHFSNHLFPRPDCLLSEDMQTQQHCQTVESVVRGALWEMTEPLNETGSFF